MKDSQLKNLSLFTEIEDEIASLKRSNILVIVEGKKDSAALRKLGLTRIKELNPKAIFVNIEELNETVAILTDLDDEGKRLYSKLKHALSGKGVSVDDRLRRLIFKTPVRHIEGLATYLEKWKSQRESK